jgi:hypothetical protein
MSLLKIILLDNIIHFHSEQRAAQRSALAAVGGRVDSPSRREQPKARKMLKNARPTHRQLHALLARI